MGDPGRDPGRGARVALGLPAGAVPDPGRTNARRAEHDDPDRARGARDGGRRAGRGGRRRSDLPAPRGGGEPDHRGRRVGPDVGRVPRIRTRGGRGGRHRRGPVAGREPGRAGGRRRGVRPRPVQRRRARAVRAGARRPCPPPRRRRDHVGAPARVDGGPVAAPPRSRTADRPERRPRGRRDRRARHRGPYARTRLASLAPAASNAGTTRSRSSGAASASRRIATPRSRRRSASGWWNGTGSGPRGPSSTGSSRCGGTAPRRDGPDRRDRARRLAGGRSPGARTTRAPGRPSGRPDPP